ncbi:hypothetical protein IX83_02470 [Basilea psittacipulmonis DSM 24701]|uniref:RDD domain-containing protein n=1 Tax=Basilea psittacipulmonis DSM 24701 TaxID=1072685 RepID=A0A077DGP5_9BURK|nr:hypothetical protein IX83_02470 [Basilea psittacipulmonis DSM 24701]
MVVLLLEIIKKTGELPHTLTSSVLFLAYGMYFFICWRKGGQTLAMKTWHIKLISFNTNHPNGLQLILRYVLSWVLPLLFCGLMYAISQACEDKRLYIFFVLSPLSNFLPSFFNKKRLMLHEIISKTALVSTK